MIESDDQSYVRALWRSFTAWVQRDALYRELMALDARGLKDIGITRADIPAVVEGRFWRGGGDMDELERGKARPPNHPVSCAATPSLHTDVRVP